MMGTAAISIHHTTNKDHLTGEVEPASIADGLVS
jgi:hypothetical protein